MDQALADVFEQARSLVAEADRKLAEAEERQREKEREASLTELAVKVDAALDFTSKEKLQLEQRMDLQDGRPQVEFVVRNARTMFILVPQEDEKWKLTALQDGREPQLVGEYKGGTKADPASRRLAAARIVTAMGNWTQNVDTAVKKPTPVQPRWREEAAQAVQAVPPASAPAPERREPTYGTFGKFLGY